MRKIINHKSAIIKVIWWVFVSLVAIAVLENNALLGLASAVVGGIALGILLFVK